jgi:hypothetical protein
LKIAFIIERPGFLKGFGPVIDSALGRQWLVEIWYGPMMGFPRSPRPLDAKVLRNLDLPDSWNGKVAVREFNEIEELPRLVQDHSIEAIFSLWTRVDLLAVPIPDCKFITLQEGIDNFVNQTPENLASSDLHCLFSPFWKDWAAAYYEAAGECDRLRFETLMKGGIVFTGYTALDGFDRLDRDEIRKLWGIPERKSIVLLLPVTLQGVQGVWPRFFSAHRRFDQLRELVRGCFSREWKASLQHTLWMLRNWNEASMVNAISRFCKKNDAFLIVKSRRKDLVRPYLEEIADLVLHDESNYPATIYDALSIADLCIHFYSTVILEAAVASVPGLNVHRPNPLKGKKGEIAHKLWRLRQPGSAFNFAGVSAMWDIPTVMKRLPKTPLSEFRIDEERRRTYIEKYLGWADGKASERVLDAVQALH